MNASTITRDWVTRHLPDRPARSHKGTYGKVLVVAGSREYAGAPLLAGTGAARAGAGLVCLALPESLALRLVGEIPELITLPLEEETAGVTTADGWMQAWEATAAYEATVVGPGLGRRTTTQDGVRRFVEAVRGPAVVDADGLNALAEGGRWWETVSTSLVLTPHPGEFARLIGAERIGSLADDDDARLARAQEAAARWGQVVVLKGAFTVVADPEGEAVVSDVATPALSTAGSGDVLAGAIGAFLASGCAPGDAAILGVAVHGAAGQLAEQRIGRAGVMARDIANLLPQAMETFRGSGSR